MRHLILMRHAKAEKHADSGEDKDRPLDERGESDTAVIGHWLWENSIAPDRILVSASTRTRQTWTILSDVLADRLPNSDVAFMDELYLASASEIFKIIRATPAKIKTLMVVGHNPGLHELAWSLTGEASTRDRNALAINLPTAAAAMIDFPGSDWKKLTLQSGRLERFISPRLLREQAD